MKFLVLCLFPLTLISRLFKTQAVFTNTIEGRNRNPVFPEQGRFTKKDAQAICKPAMRWSRQLQQTMG